MNHKLSLFVLLDWLLYRNKTIKTTFTIQIHLGAFGWTHWNEWPNYKEGYKQLIRARGLYPKNSYRLTKQVTIEKILG